MQKKTIKSRNLLPILYMNTPSIEEDVEVKNKKYTVISQIDVSVFHDDYYLAVISKNFVFENGYVKSILLKYFDKVTSYDTILDLIDDFMEKC